MRFPVFDAVKSDGNGALMICSRVKFCCAHAGRHADTSASRIGVVANRRFIRCSFAKIICTNSVSVAGLLWSDRLNRNFWPLERPADLHDALRPRRFRFARCRAVECQVRFPAKADASFEADLFLRRPQTQVIQFDAARAHVEYTFAIAPPAGARVWRSRRKTCRNIPTAKFYFLKLNAAFAVE